jgi:hypothetical protein
MFENVQIELKDLEVNLLYQIFIRPEAIGIRAVSLDKGVPKLQFHRKIESCNEFEVEENYFYARFTTARKTDVVLNAYIFPRGKSDNRVFRVYFYEANLKRHTSRCLLYSEWLLAEEDFNKLLQVLKECFSQQQKEV